MPYLPAVICSVSTQLISLYIWEKRRKLFRRYVASVACLSRRIRRLHVTVPWFRAALHQAGGKVTNE